MSEWLVSGVLYFSQNGCLYVQYLQAHQSVVNAISSLFVTLVRGICVEPSSGGRAIDTDDSWYGGGVIPTDAVMSKSSTHE